MNNVNYNLNNKIIENTHIDQLSKVEKRVWKIIARDYHMEYDSDFIVYSWPLCFMGKSQDIFEQPLFETIHIVYNDVENYFDVVHGFDNSCWGTDEIVHSCSPLTYKGYTFEKALEVGKKHFLALVCNSEHVINEDDVNKEKPFSQAKNSSEPLFLTLKLKSFEKLMSDFTQ